MGWRNDDTLDDAATFPLVVTIEDAYEPYLLQQGLLQRTSRGRMAGPRAWAS